jgi:hypothetical protein
VRADFLNPGWRAEDCPHYQLDPSQVRTPEGFVLRANRWLKLTRCRFGSGRIDDGADFRDPVRGEAALPGVFANQLFVGRDVNAIDAIIHHITFDPLNLWSEVAEYSARFLRNGLEILVRQFSGTGNFSFNHVLGHNKS